MNSQFEAFLNREPTKYWAMGSSLNAAARKEKIDKLLETHDYIYSEKVDGNLIRAVCGPGACILQTRGISKKTGTYGEVQDKVFFSEAMSKAFSDTTVLLGELYMDGGVDKDVGAIARCEAAKAIKRQQDNEEKVLHYYIFDVLCYEGEDLTKMPVSERILYLPKAAAQINNDLVSYAKYYEAKPDTFWDRVGTILERGGEGVVMYKKSMLPCEGRTPAWTTIKVKQTIENGIDCFIYGVEPAEERYTGKDVENWCYWGNIKTGEKMYGAFYNDYLCGSPIIPISKGFYFGWPGAIKCAVYDGTEEPRIICKCAGLTEEMKTQLRDNYDDWHMRPIKITGMMVSEDCSVRHPKLISVRDEDISLEDCSLEKMLGGK